MNFTTSAVMPCTPEQFHEREQAITLYKPTPEGIEVLKAANLGHHKRTCFPLSMWKEIFQGNLKMIGSMEKYVEPLK